MSDTKYSDKEIAQFAEFAEAVCERGSKQAKFGATWPTAYWQYYVEVVSNISGMRDNPREFFESDLKMRQEWGDHIINNYQTYIAEVEAEESAKTEEPESVKALREELETLRDELKDALKALKEVDSEAKDEPEAKDEGEAAVEEEDDEAEAEAEGADEEEETAEEA